MKRTTIFLIFILSATLSFGQNSHDDYSFFSKKAVKQWQIKWDAEQYKKDLPAIEAKENARPK